MEFTTYIEKKLKQRQILCQNLNKIPDIVAANAGASGRGKQNYTNYGGITAYDLRSYQWVKVTNKRTNKEYSIYLQLFDEKHLISNMDKIYITDNNDKCNLKRHLMNVHLPLKHSDYLEIIKILGVEETVTFEINESDNDQYMKAKINYIEVIKNTKDQIISGLGEGYTIINDEDSFIIEITNNINKKECQIYLSSYDRDTNSNNKHILLGRITKVFTDNKASDKEDLYNKCSSMDLPLTNQELEELIKDI